MGSSSPATCQCAELVNAKDPERERCLIECGAEIDRKSVKCRPCAKGNHTGRPCQRYVRETVYHFTSTRTCAECGIDSALHAEGSDGRPN